MNSRWLRPFSIVFLGLPLLLGPAASTTTAALEVDSGKIDSLRRYVDTHPTEVKAKFKLGALYFFNKQFSEAVLQWRDILNNKSLRLSAKSKTKLARVMAISYFKDGNLKFAWHYIKWAYANDPEDPKIVKIYQAIKKKWDERNNVPPVGLPPTDPGTPAVASTPTPTPTPTPVPISLEEAKTAYVEGKKLFEEGRESLNRADPKYEDLLSKAISQFDKAVQGNYKPESSNYYLGSSYLYRGDDEKKDIESAQKFLETSLKLNENEDGAWFSMGQVYGLLGNRDKEIEAYEKAIAINSEDAEYHFHAALAYDKSKREDAARKTFEHAKAAIRLNAEYKKRFQEVLKNSEVARQIAEIVRDIIEKTEAETLTDEETQKYAEQIQNMLGEKLDAEDFRDKDKMRELMDSKPELKEAIEKKAGKSFDQLLDDPNAQKQAEQLLKKLDRNNQ